MTLKEKIHRAIVGDPKAGVAGLQDDWWTGIVPDVAKSHGSWLYDAGSQREILDLMGFFGTSPLAYDHPKLWEKPFLDKLAKAAVHKPSNSDFWTPEMAEFVETFRRVAVPDYMAHLFFIDGGALAVENALKAAFDWKVRLNVKKGLIEDPQEERRPLGTRVLSFENAFHGRSGYTLTLTHTTDPRKYKYFPKFDWFRVVPPVLSFPVTQEVAERVSRETERALSEVREILQKHGDDVAAIVVEPIQAEGGDNHIPKDFFVGLRRLADEHDVLLIYDEVQTGFGTTGQMWAHQWFGPEARPDLIAFGKKSQVCGCMANYEKMARVPENVFSNTYEGKSRLNSTWGGNLVDMVRATRILEIIEEENLVENARSVGEYFLSRLRELEEEFPELIGNARGRGLMLAFDALREGHQGLLWEKFLERGLLVMTCGPRSLRMRPHLDLTREEVDAAVEMMRDVLSKVRSEG